MTSRLKGTAKASIVAAALKVESGGGVANRNSGEVAVEGFRDDFFMVQVGSLSPEGRPYIWLRYVDANNGYRLYAGPIPGLCKVVDGKVTQLSNMLPDLDYSSVKVKIYNDNGSHRFKPIFNSAWTGEPAWLLGNADFRAESASEFENVVP